MADDIWVYDFKTKELENITNNPALDIIPMWTGNRIYFLSDRDENKRMNLYVYDLNNKETRRLPISKNSTSNSLPWAKAIVFENGGYIYRLDLEKERTKKIPVTIADDMLAGRSKMAKVGKDTPTMRSLPMEGGRFRCPGRNIRGSGSNTGIPET